MLQLGFLFGYTLTVNDGADGEGEFCSEFRFDCRATCREKVTRRAKAKETAFRLKRRLQKVSWSPGGKNQCYSGVV